MSTCLFFNTPQLKSLLITAFAKSSFRLKLKQGLQHCKQILYQLSYQGSPFLRLSVTLLWWKKNRQSKGLWWITLFSPSVHRPGYLWIWQTPLPVWRCHTRSSYYVYVLPGTQRHWTLSLRQKLSTFVQGNPRLMPLSSLLWVLLAFTFSGRDASKHGCECSGWKDCTQACGTSQALGEERRVGEKHTYYDFNLGFLWVPN